MKKLVIIDDILPNALLIKGIVKRIGDVEATTFTDPVEALRWCKVEDPDLILLDYHMPELNGIEFLEAARRHDTLADTPIVVITGEEDKEVFYRALDAGANDFLHKPIDDVELIARSRNMLRLRARQQDLAVATDKLRELANIDALTGLANRRYFLECYGIEFERALRYRRPLSVAMLDIDHFKRVNDSHGHDAGDKVLRALSEIIVRELRTVDRVGRWGGEEFAICLTETGIDGAKQACERLVAAAAAAAVDTDDGRIGFTVSIGVTAITSAVKDPPGLLKRADALLYQAKSAGRNCVVVDRPEKGGCGDNDDRATRKFEPAEPS